MMIWGQPGKLCMFKEKFKTKCFHMSYTYHIHHRLSYISPITIIVLKISFSLLFAKINYESHNISHWMCQIHHVKPLHGNKGDFYLRGYFWLIILIFKYVKKLKQENVYRNVIQPQFWTILKEIIMFFILQRPNVCVKENHALGCCRIPNLIKNFNLLSRFDTSAK